MAEKKPITRASLKRTKGYRELRKSILDSLNARGLVELQFRDLAEQYMDCWCDVQLATAEIDEKGVTILDERRGTPMANPACAVKRNAVSTMAQLFSKLGFDQQARQADAWAEDDDEL